MNIAIKFHKFNMIYKTHFNENDSDEISYSIKIKYFGS